MKCNECGQQINSDAINQKIIICPYCGSSKFLGDVSKQKKNKTKDEIQNKHSPISISIDPEKLSPADALEISYRKGGGSKSGMFDLDKASPKDLKKMINDERKKGKLYVKLEKTKAERDTFIFRNLNNQDNNVKTIKEEKIKTQPIKSKQISPSNIKDKIIYCAGFVIVMLLTWFILFHVL